MQLVSEVTFLFCSKECDCLPPYEYYKLSNIPLKHFLTTGGKKFS